MNAVSMSLASLPKHEEVKKEWYNKMEELESHKVI